jgi:catechol 2,3-dioxygenase-like lactoylglutathione lyase family enzyme
MSRVQLALNVRDVDAAVDFYERLFATPVAKRKPGYANFEIADPPLKLVLIEAPEGGTLNHLGVETTDAVEVRAAEARLAGTGLATTGVEDTTCCYATKTETWVSDPDGARWEWYVKTGDAEEMGQHEGVTRRSRPRQPPGSLRATDAHGRCAPPTTPERTP